jgi:predicted ATPase
MFTSIRMENFKSWRDTGQIELGNLTAVFGANSSGKSSLLQMLLLLKQTTESNDRNLVLKTGSLQEGYVNLGTISEIMHGDTDNLAMHIGWTALEPIDVMENSVPVQIKNLNFRTEIRTNGKEAYVEKIEYKGVDVDLYAMMKRESENRYAVKAQFLGKEAPRPQARPRKNIAKPNKCYGFSDDALRYYQNAPYLADLVFSFEQQFQRLFYLGPLREYPQRIYTWSGEKPTDVGLKGELAVPALLSARGKRVYPGNNAPRTPFERRIASWLKDLGMAATFETKPLVENGIQYEARLRRFEGGADVLITDMGFGVSQLLPVLVLCYYAPAGSTIILEQPEIHLHPSVQSGLADVFIDVVNKRNIQLIIESHSEHLLRRIQRRIAEKQIRLDQAKLYFCEIENGVSTIKPLDIDSFGSIRNWPKDFFGDLTGDLYIMAQTGIQREMQNGASR